MSMISIVFKLSLIFIVIGQCLVNYYQNKFNQEVLKFMKEFRR